MNTLYTFSSLFNGLLALCMIFGGIFAIRSARRNAFMKLQGDSLVTSEQTINAMKERLDILEKRQEELGKENAGLRQIIETIKAALLKRGIHITIDGDMVIIEEAARTSAVKRPAARTKDNGSN